MTEIYNNDTRIFQDVKFRDGVGLQSRELNAMQQALQRQIASIGSHMFKNGTAVIGGALSFSDIKTVVVDSAYAGADVELDLFVDDEISELDAGGAATGATGRVMAVSYANGSDNSAIHYVKSAVKDFGTGSLVRTSTGARTAAIKTAESPFYDASAAQLSAGTFFFNGRFVKVEQQQIVHSKFTNKFSGYVGIEFEETIVTEFDDSTLFDPARGHSNSNAPGAHRTKITGTLAAKSYSDVLSSSFAIIAELQNGEIKNIRTDAELNKLGDTLARRTFDESGNYVKNMFKGAIIDSVEKNLTKIEPSGTALVANVSTAYPHQYDVGDAVEIKNTVTYNGTYTVQSLLNSLQFSVSLTSANANTETDIGTVSRTEYFGVSVGSGKAYVRGYEVNIPSNTEIEIPRALTTELAENSRMSIGFGSYVLVDNVVGLFDPTAATNTLQLRELGAITGTAVVTGFTQDVTAGQHRVYVKDVKMLAGNALANVDEILQLAANNPTSVDATANPVGTMKIREVNRATMLTQLANLEISTLKPSGADTLSYEAAYSSVVNSVGFVATFVLTGSSLFAGARSTNIANTTDYVFADGTTGAIITPTSVVISADGTNMVVTTVASPSVAVIGKIDRYDAVVTKTLQTSTIAVAGGVIDSTNLEYDLGLTDVQSVTILDSNLVDVTDSYTLNGNQHDMSIDNSTITLKSGVTNPGAITITANWLQRSSNDGYVTVDSYPSTAGFDYDTNNGLEIDIRNTIDFRVNNGAGNANIQTPDSILTADFKYFLPRRDLIVLNSAGDLVSIPGVPAIDPKYPEPADDQMVLFKLEVLGRTANPDVDVSLQRSQVVRQTMEDIGLIGRRLARLEYETSLSLLESSAKQSDIVDAAGNSRFKTGFIVDNFSEHGVGAVNSADYVVAVDPDNAELRPAFTTTPVALTATNRSKIAAVGNHITLEHTRADFISNLAASKGVSVTPYLVTTYRGVMSMNPSSDYWHDQTKAPVNNVDFVKTTPKFSAATQSKWNEWQRGWTGISKIADDSGMRRPLFSSVATSTDFRAIPKNVRTPVAASPQSVSLTSVGNSLVDFDIVHNMRAVTIEIVATGMRPNTTVHLFIDDAKIDSLVTGTLTTDTLGNVTVTVAIPGATYKTGDRLFTLTDEPNNVSENATTEASFVFSSAGVISTVQETIVTTRTPQPPVKPVSRRRPRTSRVSTSRPKKGIVVTQKLKIGSGGGLKKLDPLAQSFSVSAESYPNGLFVYDIDLFFKRKPSTASSGPVTVQLRPMVNGYPSSDDVIPMSEMTIPHASVNIASDINDMTSIIASPTNSRFDTPIYLAPGFDYCFVTLANDPDYELFVSELGQVSIGTQDTITQQPTLGSSFRSQNAVTWTAFQNEDLMFKLGICEFDTASSASFTLAAVTDVDNRYFDVIELKPQLLEFSDSLITFEMTSVDAQSLIAISQDIIPNANIQMSSQRIIRGGIAELTFAVELQTDDQWTAPIFDLDRQFATAVSNQINNYGLKSDGFIVESVGAGIVTGDAINISGGGGTGATASAIAVAGELIGVNLTNAGSGYTSAPTITGPGGSTIGYTGLETDHISGNALARYITKPIQLAEGFSSDGATCYVDINMPANTNIELYFRKMNSAEDNVLTSKDWALATAIDKPNTANDEFVEAKFELDLSYTTGTGEVFAESDQLQAKLVLTSSNTAVVPKCKNFRLITTI